MINRTPRDKRYRDPVYGYVTIPGELLPVVNSPYVQRLRNISQNSRAIAAYPGLNGSRYEHALGTMHLAVQAWRSCWDNMWARDDMHAPSVANVRHAFRHDISESIWSLKKTNSYIPDVCLDRVFPDERNLKSDDHWVAEFFDVVSNAVAAVGLLHDVGHPPFSHVLEGAYQGSADKILGAGSIAEFESFVATRGENKAQFHEWASKVIVDKILADTSLSEMISTNLVWHIFTAGEELPNAGETKESWAFALHGLVDGEIDVDRLDYIRRDSLRAGATYDAIDMDRLVSNIELHNVADQQWKVGIGQRAISAVESMLLQRDQSYRWMIFHERALLADTALQRSFEIALASLFFEDSELLRQFDYVAQWDSPLNGSFTVDDHFATVKIREKAAAGSKPEAEDPATEEMATYLSIWDSMSYAAIPAWRTYGEFLDAVELVGTQWLADNFGYKLPTRIADRTRKHCAQAVLMALKSAWAGGDIGGVHHAPMRDIELAIEEELNKHHRQVAGVEGLWLVAQRFKFNAIKSTSGHPGRDREVGLELWDGSSLESFKNLSPIYEGLDSANDVRPMIWAWFVPSSTETISAGNRDALLKSVRLSFLETCAQTLKLRANRD